jgi:hypothetical protein
MTLWPGATPATRSAGFNSSALEREGWADSPTSPVTHVLLACPGFHAAQRHSRKTAFGPVRRHPAMLAPARARLTRSPQHRSCLPGFDRRSAFYSSGCFVPSPLRGMVRCSVSRVHHGHNGAGNISGVLALRPARYGLLKIHLPYQSGSMPTCICFYCGAIRTDMPDGIAV